MPTSTVPLSRLPQAPERIKGCCQPLVAALDDAQADQLSSLYRALADPTRIQMVHMLAAAAEPVCVCDFTATFELGQPTISHHLAKLREAGIVDSFRRGIWSFYMLNRRMEPAARAAIELIP